MRLRVVLCEKNAETSVTLSTTTNQYVAKGKGKKLLIDDRGASAFSEGKRAEALP